MGAGRGRGRGTRDLTAVTRFYGTLGRGGEAWKQGSETGPGERWGLGNGAAVSPVPTPQLFLGFWARRAGAAARCPPPGPGRPRPSLCGREGTPGGGRARPCSRTGERAPHTHRRPTDPAMFPRQLLQSGPSTRHSARPRMPLPGCGQACQPGTRRPAGVVQRSPAPDFVRGPNSGEEAARHSGPSSPGKQARPGRPEREPCCPVTRQGRRRPPPWTRAAHGQRHLEGRSACQGSPGRASVTIRSDLPVKLHSLPVTTAGGPENVSPSIKFNVRPAPVPHRRCVGGPGASTPRAKGAQAV
ncbi:Fanconi anemia core complex-associated protein 20 isoform X3 [Leopardus geoffroyi]|uniref:Fanconi anemia core complex-associated protein 20 isoform X3 n=1 Tax=Leopardus geoffroyi TaxID=46844 RepID=UPI001E260381|nr:Fanconi anemia core complex-associated protein 20 isoform X3 [Leopardus geoffroyi]